MILLEGVPWYGNVWWIGVLIGLGLLLIPVAIQIICLVFYPIFWLLALERIPKFVFECNRNACDSPELFAIFAVGVILMWPFAIILALVISLEENGIFTKLTEFRNKIYRIDK